MRKALISLAILTSMVVGGCTIDNAPDPSDPNFPALVEKSKQQVRTDATIAVAVYLGLIDNNDKRAKVGALSYEVASIVNQAVKNNDVNLEDVRKYANDLLSKSGVEDNQRAGLILNAVVATIQNHADVRLGLSGDNRSQVVRELILGATEGVMEQTQQFKYVPRAALPRPQ